MAEKVILELKDKDFIKTKLLNSNKENNEQEMIFRDIDKQIKSSLVSM